jgi:hypothetical protein
MKGAFMLGTLKGAVLVCAAAIIPFAAATVMWAPVAQAAASASAVCSGGKQVASAPLKANGSTWGTIHLCYNSSSAQSWGVVTSGMPACWASHDVYGCGGATVEHKGGTGAKNCNIARHAKTCATGRIPDGPSTPSNASAQVCILPAAPFACEQWAGGQTTNYP